MEGRRLRLPLRARLSLTEAESPPRLAGSTRVNPEPNRRPDGQHHRSDPPPPRRERSRRRTDPGGVERRGLGRERPPRRRRGQLLLPARGRQRRPPRAQPAAQPVLLEGPGELL